MKGNRDQGPEDIDRPFAKRRNLGKKSGGKVTRADAVAVVLAQATTVRELGDLAIQLGTPEALVANILNRPHRNSIKIMHLHSAARHHYKKRQEERKVMERKRFPPGLATKIFKIR